MIFPICVYPYSVLEAVNQAFTVFIAFIESWNLIVMGTSQGKTNPNNYSKLFDCVAKLHVITTYYKSLWL